MAFGHFLRNARVTFEDPRGSGDPRVDVAVVLTHPSHPRSGRILLQSRFLGYLPSAFLLALLFATPMRWRRRAWSLVGAVMLVNVFVMCRLLASLLVLGERVSLWGGERWQQLALAWFHSTVVRSGTSSFIVPMMIWIVVSFSRKDLETLLVRHDTLDTR